MDKAKFAPIKDAFAFEASKKENILKAPLLQEEEEPE